MLNYQKVPGWSTAGCNLDRKLPMDPMGPCFVLEHPRRRAARWRLQRNAGSPSTAARPWRHFEVDIYHLSICTHPSIHLSIYLSIYLFIYIWFSIFYRSIVMFFLFILSYPSIYLPSYIYIYAKDIPISLSTNLPTYHLSSYLYVSIHLSIYPSI